MLRSGFTGQQLEDQTAFARDGLQEVLASMKNEAAGIGDGDDEELNPDGTKKYRIPAHLQDLGPDDLPEESRGLITREIAFFRERAAKREEASKVAEQKRDSARRQIEEQRQMAHLRNQDDRSPRVDQPSRFAQQQHHQSNQHHPSAPNGPRAGGYQQSPPLHRNDRQDPQSYGRPLAFVSSGGSSTSNAVIQNHVSDEDAEQQRQARKREQMEQQYRLRLGNWEKREKSRMQTVDREKQTKYSDAKNQDRRRTEMLEKCASFDDDDEVERGDELFIIDRCVRRFASSYSEAMFAFPAAKFQAWQAWHGQDAICGY